MRAVTEPTTCNTPDLMTADAALGAAKERARLLRKLKRIGVTRALKISDTLQGSIWRTTQDPWGAVSPGSKSEASVIKITSQFLHQHSVGMVKNETFNVAEDILLEQSILKYLTQHKECPQSIVKFRHFFETSNDYFLVMQDGGACLFDFIKDAHRLIRKRSIAMTEWHKVVNVMFRQIIECVDYIHSKNVVHFDISLENFLVNDVRIELVTNVQSKESKLTFVADDLQVKLCDFGLSELFTKTECVSSKYSGKKQYKSPEVISGKRQYDAKANDIWCMGVCLFMIATGCPPWDVAWKSDKTFRYVTKKSMKSLLKAWKLDSCVDAGLADILNRIFQPEQSRITLEEIKMHPFMLEVVASLEDMQLL